MKKEDVMLLSQLLYTMQEVVTHLEKAYKKGDDEKLLAAKREVLDLQRRINEIL